jgi:hypothetical protein
MIDIIDDRLRGISSLDDRKLLKDVLRDVYENLAEYNLAMYAKLESRLYSEIECKMDDFAIYAAAEHVENIDPVSDFLHPIILEDTDTVLNLAEISENLKNQPNPVIASIFMRCSNSEISRLLEENNIFKGVITTDQNTYDITAKAKRSQRYINQLDKLYRAFQRNSVAWTTVNCPYIYKFVDIILDAPVTLAEGEVINEITMDLGRYDQYKQVNVVPVWNVKTVELDERSFPMPAIDRVNYEHSISLEDTGVKNGYLVALDSPDYLYTLRRENELVVISDSDTQQKWKLLKIERPDDAKRQRTGFEIFSNKRDASFVSRYAAIKSVVIRTMGELDRMLNSYEHSRSVSFLGVEILDAYEKTKETVEFNSFIDDNVRIDANKKVMLLKFRMMDGNTESFLIYDKISFLVSEVQMVFPEYNCIGERVL